MKMIGKTMLKTMDTGLLTAARSSRQAMARTALASRARGDRRPAGVAAAATGRVERSGAGGHAATSWGSWRSAT